MLHSIVSRKDSKTRNEVILKTLRKLNVVSQLEGLLQLLNPAYSVIENNEDNEKEYRALQMILFTPNIVKHTLLGNKDPDLYTNYLKEQIGLSAKVRQYNLLKRNQSKTDSPFLPSKVFVGNISFKTKQRDLWDFFQYYGEVLRATIVKDHRTKRSRGFGFVLFASPLSAEKALKAKKIELLLDGRCLKVTPAVRKRGKQKQASMYAAEKRLKEAVDQFCENKISNLHNDQTVSSDQNQEQITSDKQEEEKDELSWSHIPDVILCGILAYLDLKHRLKIEQVCKRWMEISSLSWSLLKNMHFKNVFGISKLSTTAGLTDKVLISLIRKGCYNLKSLDLSASPYFVSHVGLAFVCKNCVLLQEIDFSQVKLECKTLKLIGETLVHLKKIVLDFCDMVGEKGLWWLLKGLKQLEHLEIKNCSRYRGNCFYMLPETLKTAVITSCLMFTDEHGMKYLSRCVNLTHLHLSHLTGISQTGLRHIFEKCRKLETLVLRSLCSVTEIDSFESFPHLHHLDLGINSCVNNETLIDIVQSCTLLRTLNIEACHSITRCDGLRLLATLPHLEELNISYIICVDDACIDDFALEGRLKRLYVCACPGVTDKGVTSCLSTMEHLNSLDLSGCYNVIGSFVNDVNILKRNNDGEVLHLFLGGTEMNEEDITSFAHMTKNCKVYLSNRSKSILRNDFGTLVARPFFPEYESEVEDDGEDDVDFDEEQSEWIEWDEPAIEDLPAEVLDDGHQPLWELIVNDDWNDETRIALLPPSETNYGEGELSSNEEDWDKEIDCTNI